MHKVVLRSLLAAAGAVSFATFAMAQTPDAAAGGQGQVQMSQEEYNAYQKGVTATSPADKATAFEAYLKQYPNSAVKTEALNQILFADSQTGDQTKTLDAADRLLAVDPNNLRALTFEVFYRRADADKLTDATAKQTALDQVAGYAQKGLNATAPKGMSDADFTALKGKTTPVFESAIADDDLAKKDNAGAITALKTELTSAPPAQLTAVGPVLQDEYTLATAYYTLTPPDYLNCAYYASRAGQYAPDPVKTQIQQLATYCYQKYHGSNDAYANFQTLAQANVTPPADLATTVTPAPTPEEMIKKTLSDPSLNLATLALSDREQVIQYGQPDDADKVFNPIKGKSVEIPGAVVIVAAPDQLQVAVSADAVQSKQADFTFTMKAPLTTVPAVGASVNLSGTYASYTQKPLMITMSDGVLVEKKAPAKTPARTTRRR